MPPCAIFRLGGTSFQASYKGVVVACATTDGQFGDGEKIGCGHKYSVYNTGKIMV